MISNDALAERLDALGAEIRADIRGLNQTVLTQNGRIGAIEIARAREEGARAAVAEAAAQTAAALTVANRLRDKSRAWKLGVVTAILGGLGGIVTAGTLVAHVIVNH